MDNFARYSNYNENTSFSGIVHGADKPLLEVEMNELQQIINTKLSRVIKTIGVCVLPLAENSLVFNRDTKVLTVADSVIFADGGLTAYVKNAQVTLSAGSPCAYFKVEEITANMDSELKEFGNTAGAKVTNTIKDNRSPVETTRRKVVTYTLLSGASVPVDTSSIKYVSVGTFNSKENSFVAEEITPTADLGLSVNESGEMCVTFDEE